MSQPHMLVVTRRDGPPAFAVECPGVTDGCRSWIECRADGCDLDQMDRLAEDGDDEPELHGQRHRNLDGWSTPTNGCFIASHPDLSAVAADLWPIGGVPNGRFPVAAVYEPYGDPGDLRLKLLGPEDLTAGGAPCAGATVHD